jgi:hypothetical protein
MMRMGSKNELLDGHAKRDHGLRLWPQTTFSRTSTLPLVACE